MLTFYDESLRPRVASISSLCVSGHLATSSLSAFCFANVRSSLCTSLREQAHSGLYISCPSRFLSCASEVPSHSVPWNDQNTKLSLRLCLAFAKCFWSSPRPISSSQLHTLPYFHLRPIYLVVFKGSYFLKNGISHLEGGFTLRCLQRLSLPGLATRP